MKKIISLLLIFSSLTSFAQQNEISDLENKKKIILNQINALNDSIEKIEIQISAIKSKEIQNMISDSTLRATVKKGAKLKKTPSSLGEVITSLSEDKEVVILDYNNGYFGVCAGSICGYMGDVWVKKDDKIYDFMKAKKAEAKKLKELEQEQKLREQKLAWAELEKKYIEKYGEETYRKLQQRKCWVGMNKEMATISLGRPDDINRTVGSWGVHEQWVYNNFDLYLYFENGKLASYQD